MNNSTNSYSNVAIGWGAFNGSSMSNAYNNIAIGENSFSTNFFTGHNNVSIGVNSNQYQDTTFNAYSVAVGSYASARDAQSVAIGAYSQTYPSAVAIGYNAQASSYSIALGQDAEGQYASSQIVIGAPAGNVAQITRFKVPGMGIDWTTNLEIMQIMQAY
jgi:hypothetical protein